MDYNSDIINSKDIIKRLAELDDEYESLSSAVTLAREAHEGCCEDDRESLEMALAAAEQALAAFEASIFFDERAMLHEANKTGQQYCPDWSFGVSLISDDHFVDYIREQAKQLGVVPSKLEWPLNHINWEGAAYEVKSDYADFDIDGWTYWSRCG